MNYVTLLAALQQWMEDDSVEFSGSIERLIAIAHALVCRDLDLAIFIASSNASTANGVATLTKPVIANGFAFTPLRYTNLGRQTIMRPRSLDFVRDYEVEATAGPPLYYAELSPTQWTLAPVPNSIISVACTATINPLPPSTITTNSWVGDNFSELLFKACKHEAEGFLKADDRIDIWKKQYMEALPMAKRQLVQMMQARYQLTPLQVPAQTTIAR